MRIKYKLRHTNGRHLAQHTLTAETVLGRTLPEGAEVHHVDGDGHNNDHSNLVICPSRAYHMLLHMRTTALQESGNANFLKCRFCKKWDLPEALSISKSPRFHVNGANKHHKKCMAEYAKKRREMRQCA